MRRLWPILLCAFLLILPGLGYAQESTPDADAARLIVADTFPAPDSNNVPPDSAITVIFNRPVVPLTTREDAANLPSPITISPEVDGLGEWVNTSIYLFRPSRFFDGGTTYTVTVNPELTDVSGVPLDLSLTSWSFTTETPVIQEVFPLDGEQGITIDAPELIITFNQAVDQALVEANFSLVNTSAPDTQVPVTFAWNENGASVVVIPQEQLALDSVYEWSLSAEADLSGQTSYTFQTDPYPAIVSSDPADGAENAYPYGGITLYFASEIDPETLEGKVTIEPEPWREPEIFYYDYSNQISISFPTEPSTSYTVTIAPGVQDIYGNTIDTPTVIRYTTAPYDPDLTLQVPGPVGFYNAYRDATEMFLLHRNISRIDWSLSQIPVDAAGRMFTGQSAGYPTDDIPFDSLVRISSSSLPVSAPLNARRYELLDVGGPGGSSVPFDCPGAPETRLKVGDSAIVTLASSDSLRVRAAPPDGEILTLIYNDYVLPVTGGPTCANGAIWWEVQLREGETGWVAEGLDNEYFIAPHSVGQISTIELTSPFSEGALPPGVYYLEMTAPELLEGGYFSNGNHVLVVATANLTVKTSVDSVLVWATDVQTGQPIVNVPISIYGAGYEVLGTGTTGESGLAQIALPRAADLYAPRLAVLQSGDQFGLGSNMWSSGVAAWDFGQFGDYAPSLYRTYLYTDRPVYRPGQPVYFRGIIRQRDDVTYTPPGLTTMPVEVYNDSGEVIYSESLPIDGFGTFSGRLDLADETVLGYYTINAKLPGTDDQPYYVSFESSVGFNVAEYRLPEFQVDVTADRDEVARGDTIRVAVDSAYFFGGRVTDADVRYTVTAGSYAFAYEGDRYYDFADYDYDAGPSEFYAGSSSEIATGEGMTDEQGMLVIEVPAALEDAAQSQRWTIEATVTDESDQAVSGRAEVVVHKGLVYVGAAPAEYVGQEGQPSEVEIIAVDWESQPVANQAINVAVVERRWSSVQEQDDSGRTVWVSQVEEIPVETGSVTTDAKGEADYTFTPPAGGIYKFKLTTRDSAGNEIISATTMWVAGREYVPWRQQNSSRIDLIADQDEYTIGDLAEILITSPFQGSAQALITVERGDVLSSEVVTLDTNSYVYKLPITEDYAPNVYVSVLIVKGIDEFNPVAAFRMGLVQLGVDSSRKEITLEIIPDREQAGPRENVTYTLRATDYAGNPVQASVGVALTDLASLSIYLPNSSPLLSYFYGQQGLGVLTATPLTINTDLLTQTTLDTVKGGGGGGGGGGIFDVREEFVDTAYWNASVTTDANGEAQVSVLLPDNLTTWRLDARAVTSGSDGRMLVGQETFDLISTKPLLIRPVTPRFLVAGDQVVLAAIVNNNTSDDLTATVSLEAMGVEFTGDSVQPVTIPAGGRARVDWPVIVQDVEALDLTFTVSDETGEFGDASKPPLGQGDARLIPVYRYEVFETVATAGALDEAGTVTESIVLATDFDVTQGNLTVRLDTSLASGILRALDVLEGYRWENTEVTISRFLPNLATYQALQRLNVEDADLRADLEVNINQALQRLYAAQKADGGWGWNVQDASDALTTAYALIGLSEASSAGWQVNRTVIERAQSFLSGQFIVPALDQPQWRLNRQAFILYALARSGAPDVARASALYEARARLSIDAQAFLALAFHEIDPQDTNRTNGILSDLVGDAILSATGAHWEEPERDYFNWNSDTRTTAIVLKALAVIRPQNDLIPNVVRWLMAARRADVWETTQETAWTIMALSDVMVASGELNTSYTYRAEINGQELASGDAGVEPVGTAAITSVPLAEALTADENAFVIERGDGNGTLYYTAHLNAGLPVPEVEPFDAGVIISRVYTLPGSDEPITEARVGDLVTVRLTVIAPNALHFVQIEDPIPAGSEGVNPDVLTSQQVGTEPDFSQINSDNPLSFGWGWWWFSNIQFYDEKVVLSSTYLPAGTYEYVYTLRIGLPGIYNVIPATAREVYFPEVYGRSAGSSFTVLPEES